MSYTKTREALQSYDADPTGDKADLVRVAFWLEASTAVRACVRNPTVREVRAVLRSCDLEILKFESTGGG